MNIVHISRLYHPHIGGVEKHVQHLSAALTARGHHVTVLTSQHDPKLPLQSKHRNTDIIRLPHQATHSKFTLWHWILTHRQLFRSADIIHAHDIFWWYLPLRLINPHKPIYTTFHGWEGVYPPTKTAIAWRKLAAALSRGNICVGDFISRWYGTKPNSVTYGATSQKPLPIPRPHNLLVLGRLSADNDINLVLKALTQVKKRHPRLNITFLGDGPFSPQAKKIGRVTGFKPDITPYLKTHHYIITSSYLSLLDSLAAGRPVFSIYSNPLKKDYLTLHPASRYISISSTASQLATSLNHTLSHPHLTSTNIKPAQHWALQQTWPHLTDQYLQLWNKK